MTLEQLANFAESHGGKVYRDVCERFGVDPAQFLDDDVLAHQFRIALAYAHRPPAPPKENTAPDAFAEAREAGEKVKAMM